MSNLLETLKKLKVENDDHWTTEGLPRLDVLSKALGREVTREELNAAVPGFSRVTAAEFGASEAADKAETAPHVPTAPETLPETVQVAADAPPAPELEDSTGLDLDALETRRRELAEVIGYHANKSAEHLKLRDEAQNELARLNAISENANGGNHASQVSAFLASEQRQRMLRVQGALALKEMGINPQELLKAISPAPVDAARARQPNAMRHR